MGKGKYTVEQDIDSDYARQRHSPAECEKNLLGAVVARAINDLESKNTSIRRDAITWILYGKDEYPAHFSFAECVSYLELTTDRVKLIRDKALAAQDQE